MAGCNGSHVRIQHPVAINRTARGLWLVYVAGIVSYIDLR